MMISAGLLTSFSYLMDSALWCCIFSVCGVFAVCVVVRLSAALFKCD